jgi:hypothetical protein
MNGRRRCEVIVHVMSEYAEFGYDYDWAAANWFKSSPVKVSVSKLCNHGSAATRTPCMYQAPELSEND